MVPVSKLSMIYHQESNYADDYYKMSPRENPSGPETGSERVIRGGSWGFTAENCRSASRYTDPTSERGDNLGFRLVRRV